MDRTERQARDILAQRYQIDASDSVSLEVAHDYADDTLTAWFFYSGMKIGFGVGRMIDSLVVEPPTSILSGVPDLDIIRSESWTTQVGLGFSGPSISFSKTGSRQNIRTKSILDRSELDLYLAAVFERTRRIMHRHVALRSAPCVVAVAMSAAMIYPSVFAVFSILGRGPANFSGLKLVAAIAGTAIATLVFVACSSDEVEDHISWWSWIHAALASCLVAFYSS